MFLPHAFKEILFLGLLGITSLANPKVYMLAIKDTN